MNNESLSIETKSLIEQLDKHLSGYKECVDGCKTTYMNCIGYCSDYVCRAKCRGSLETCINGCPGLNMDSDALAKMNSLLDEIEASLSN